MAAHTEQATAMNRRTTRLNSPRGFSVSANGSRSEPTIRKRLRSSSKRRVSAFARGFRLSSELVAGVLVGAGIGWLIDRWLG